MDFLITETHCKQYGWKLISERQAGTETIQREYSKEISPGVWLDILYKFKNNSIVEGYAVQKIGEGITVIPHLKTFHQLDEFFKFFNGKNLAIGG